MRILLVSILAVTVVGVGTSANATVTTSADPDYITSAPVFTLDPELYGPAARNLAGTRQLRQTFQNPETFDVTGIILSLGVESTASGITLEFFEVDDVNAGSWTVDLPIQTINVPAGDLVTSSERLGVYLSDGDVFTLPQRDFGAEGYGIQLSVDDGSTNVGPWRHTNDGVDNYVQGVYYSEGGSPPQPYRDMGVNLIPEPSVTMLMLGGLGLLGLLRRRK